MKKSHCCLLLSLFHSSRFEAFKIHLLSDPSLEKCLLAIFTLGVNSGISPARLVYTVFHLQDYYKTTSLPPLFNFAWKAFSDWADTQLENPFHLPPSVTILSCFASGHICPGVFTNFLGLSTKKCACKIKISYK